MKNLIRQSLSKARLIQTSLVKVSHFTFALSRKGAQKHNLFNKSKEHKFNNNQDARKSKSAWMKFFNEYGRLKSDPDRIALNKIDSQSELNIVNNQLYFSSLSMGFVLKNIFFSNGKLTKNWVTTNVIFNEKLIKMDYCNYIELISLYETMVANKYQNNAKIMKNKPLKNMKEIIIATRFWINTLSLKELVLCIVGLHYYKIYDINMIYNLELKLMDHLKKDMNVNLNYKFSYFNKEFNLANDLCLAIRNFNHCEKNTTLSKKILGLLSQATIIYTKSDEDNIGYSNKNHMTNIELYIVDKVSKYTPNSISSKYISKLLNLQVDSFSNSNSLVFDSLLYKFLEEVPMLINNTKFKEESFVEVTSHFMKSILNRTSNDKAVENTTTQNNNIRLILFIYEYILNYDIEQLEDTKNQFNLLTVEFINFFITTELYSIMNLTANSSNFNEKVKHNSIYLSLVLYKRLEKKSLLTVSSVKALNLIKDIYEKFKFDEIHQKSISSILYQYAFCDKDTFLEESQFSKDFINLLQGYFNHKNSDYVSEVKSTKSEKVFTGKDKNLRLSTEISMLLDDFNSISKKANGIIFYDNDCINAPLVFNDVSYIFTKIIDQVTQFLYLSLFLCDEDAFINILLDLEYLKEYNLINIILTNEPYLFNLFKNYKEISNENKEEKAPTPFISQYDYTTNSLYTLLSNNYDKIDTTFTKNFNNKLKSRQRLVENTIETTNNPNFSLIKKDKLALRNNLNSDLKILFNLHSSILINKAMKLVTSTELNNNKSKTRKEIKEEEVDENDYTDIYNEVFLNNSIEFTNYFKGSKTANFLLKTFSESKQLPK